MNRRPGSVVARYERRKEYQRITPKEDVFRPAYDESKIRRCYMICVDCRTKFTSHDPPERIVNRFQCSFCEGPIVLEHQLPDVLAHR